MQPKEAQPTPEKRLLDFVTAYSGTLSTVSTSQPLVVSAGSETDDHANSVTSPTWAGGKQLDNGYMTQSDDSRVQVLFVASPLRPPFTGKSARAFVHAYPCFPEFVKTLEKYFAKRHANIYVLDYDKVRSMVRWKTTKSDDAVVAHLYAGDEGVSEDAVLSTYHKYPGETVTAKQYLYQVTITMLKPGIDHTAAAAEVKKSRETRKFRAKEKTLPVAEDGPAKASAAQVEASADAAAPVKEKPDKQVISSRVPGKKSKPRDFKKPLDTGTGGKAGKKKVPAAKAVESVE